MRPFGLRPRLLAALLLTSAVTLAVAALTLLSPLETRLRNDGVATVLTALTASRTDFEDVPVIDGRPDPTALAAEALRTQRRSNAQLFIVNFDLQPLFGPADPSLQGDLADVRTALATRRINHQVVGGLLDVAAPMRVGGPRGPYVGLALRRRLGYVAEAGRVVRNAFITAAAAGLGTALVLGLALTTTLLRRLERLRDSTRELERHGLEAPAPEDAGRDEVGELARAFASMHRRLRRQEEARRAFVATASHELRTPLASLDGMLELLDDDLNAQHLDLEDARERTALAKEQSRRLSQLAADLLDLSRLDADVTLRSEPIELGELSRAVAAEFELRAAQAGVQISLLGADASCWVSADPGSLARISRILLDNALRVAPEGSEITLELECGKVWASLAVADRGPGVPAGERELIFQRFQRGSNTAGESGFGLGLAIGRELAGRMGGSLALEEQAANGRGAGPGARFVLRLPSADMTGNDRR